MALPATVIAAIKSTFSDAEQPEALDRLSTEDEPRSWDELRQRLGLFETGAPPDE